MDVKEIHSHKNDVCGVTNAIPGKRENRLEILLTLVAEQGFSKSYLWPSFPSCSIAFVTNLSKVAHLRCTIAWPHCAGKTNKSET